MIVDLASYDLIIIESSSGKDSQCALDEAVRRCDAAGVDRRRLVVVHCALGRVEWPGCEELAAEQAAVYGLPCLLVSKRQGDLLAQARQRRMWPSSMQRWCTSDHKRAQGRRVATALVRLMLGEPAGDPERGAYPLPDAMTLPPRISPAGSPLRVLSVMGMRAAESPKRAKLPVLKRTIGNGRWTLDTWLPIHGWSLDDVWRRIFESGLPYHWAYDLDGDRSPRVAKSPQAGDHRGMPRLSCTFCIFAPAPVLLRAGHERPDLLREYAAVEQEIKHDFRVGTRLVDILAQVEAGVLAPAALPEWAM